MGTFAQVLDALRLRRDVVRRVEDLVHVPIYSRARAHLWPYTNLFLAVPVPIYSRFMAVHEPIFFSRARTYL
jgi:hypothetical protein